MSCGHAGCTCAPDTESSDAKKDEKREPIVPDHAEPEGAETDD